jgi:hypothetical protein
MSHQGKRRADSSNTLDAAVREIDSLAQRRHWSEQTRREAQRLITTSSAGTTGPSEIGQRFKAIARTIGRAERARFWQAIRRVVPARLRSDLDAVYRSKL